MLLVTHFMDEAERLCDRLAVLRDGRVVASGTRDELVAATLDSATISPQGRECRWAPGSALDAAAETRPDRAAPTAIPQAADSGR